MLNGLLGASAITEDFESFNVDNGTAVVLDTLTLDSSTTFEGQGPGLVVDGVSFSSTRSFQWNGVDWFGQPSKNIIAPSAYMIDFTLATPAFGVDLLVFFPIAADITIFGEDDTTELANFPQVTVSSQSSPVFFGFSDVAGIGKVLLSSNIPRLGPTIDNLTFQGAAAEGPMPSPAPIPEPGTLLLLGSGLVGIGVGARRRRRK